jgi:tetratricopeptide (TPR) repeat protein
MFELAESATGRYAVKGPIGHGGMGAVYHVTDQQTGAELALKRLRLSGDAKRDRRLVELFQQEFRTLVQLAHPNVVSVHDFGTDEQGPYYTMELLDGEHLHALAPLPWPETCALLRDVCSAVALLHSRRLLHRDPSPKNVQRTGCGRAKLIDFGAMAPMGPCNMIVGTPPLVPPEALLQQPLDARADLYALGATLYYALTGRHAYPAHNLAQLSAFWRTPPAPPSAHVPGIPRELDQLVLRLLSPEPLARPSSAAEVLDRLTAIAALPRDEQFAVPLAYLSTPQLIARDEQLASVRSRLAALHAGQGGVIAIAGAHGMGRSRMLDTCVLEAKLAHMAVVRASAADAAAGSYGVLSSLVRQLQDHYGGAHTVTQRSEDLSLLADGDISAAVDAARRPALQNAFRAELEALAHLQPVVIAVDDIERCDEPSIAALAAVAAGTRDRILVAVSRVITEPDHDRGPLGILLHGAARIPLGPLAPEDTEALLASIFGEVPYLQTLAARIHERAEGSPRGCMELSQYLLDCGLVRYEMGSWVLPSSLADAALPRTLSVALRERLARLSRDARELAEVLALWEGAALEVSAFAEVTDHGDPERVRIALDELLLAQVVRSDGASYVFEAQLWPEEVKACLDPEDEQRACGRIADALARRERDRLAIASYRLRAGQAAAAIDLLLGELTEGSRWNRAPRDYGNLLRRAIDACHTLARPRRHRMMLLRELVKVGQDLAAADLRDHTLELLAELRRDSGLDAWQERVGPTEPMARLRWVCERMQTQHEASTESERGFSQLEAIIMLGTLAAETSAIAARTGDARLLELMPHLEPFYPLSPALRRMELVVPACRAVIAGRYEEAREKYEQQLAMLLDPATAGVPEDLRIWGIRALHYAIGNIEASLGREQALAHAAEIADVPGWLVPAYSIRQVYHLTMGNLREAERLRRQIELAQLQSAIRPPFTAAAVFQHVFVFSMTDNPNGLRTAIPELDALARSHPGMCPFVPYARAEQARICGNYDEALAFIERAHELVQPGEHPVWPWLVTSRLFVLLAQGRYEEAHAIGVRGAETAARMGLTVLLRGNIDVPLALVEAKLSDFASACARIERRIEERVARGMHGVALGVLHEMRARIAVWMDDADAFERHVQLCAQHFTKSGGEPAVIAKYERLLQDAQQRGLSVRTHAYELLAEHTTVTGTDSRRELHSGARALAACASREQRIRSALELIVNAAGARDGELFLVSGDSLVLAAATADGLGGAEQIPALQRMVDMNGRADATEITAAFALHGPKQPDGSPNCVWPLVLAHPRGGDMAIAGIVTLHFAASAPVRLPAELGNTVAAALIEAADVSPHVINDSATTLRA